MSPSQIGRSTSSIKPRHAPFVRDRHAPHPRWQRKRRRRKWWICIRDPFYSTERDFLLPSYSSLILPPSPSTTVARSRSMGDRYSLDAECSRIFPITAARSMRYSAKWDRPRDVCAYANREWKMRTRLRKGETGERREVTGLRGYAVTAAAVAVASVRIRPLRSGHCYTFEARSHSQEEEERRRK